MLNDESTYGSLKIVWHTESVFESALRRALSASLGQLSLLSL